jgi:crcB protein
MSRFLWICLGGAIGTGARYLISGWALRAFGTAFPYGTLAVNLLGSFLIGLVMQLSVETSWLPANLRIVLTTGVMGGFTTYSAFNYETLRYFQEGAWLWGILNILGMMLSCLLAGLLGLAMARWLSVT